jgi:glycosyltransferase involved in cell wall biosynthesis
MKRVLLISYHFPPSPAVGGLRAVNFARHLPEHGWEPAVLTLPADAESGDETHLRAVSSIPVDRVRPWLTVGDLYRKVKGAYRKTDAVSGDMPSMNREQNQGQAASLRQWVLSLLSVPDGERGWIAPAVLRALALVRRQRCACIVTSCPPYSVHVVGLLVKLMTGVRWIADFRDPWMSGGRKALYVTTALSLRLDRWLERKVVEHADVVVANTAALTEKLRCGYPGMSSTKFVTISNSIDLERFAQYWTMPKAPVFTITYTGSLYFNRSPEPVFAAIRRLIDERRLSADSIRIVLAGQCDQVGGVPTKDIVGRYGLDGVVSVLAPVAHAEALHLIRSSHLALLLAPTQPNQIPAKAYDYIGLGTQVLALASAGATADLVNTHKVGAVFEPTDISGIAGFIEAECRQRSAPDASRPPAAAAFDARLNAGRLAAVLNEARTVPSATEVVA